jgi:hypothetical protein
VKDPLNRTVRQENATDAGAKPETNHREKHAAAGVFSLEPV